MGVDLIKKPLHVCVKYITLKIFFRRKFFIVSLLSILPFLLYPPASSGFSFSHQFPLHVFP